MNLVAKALHTVTATDENVYLNFNVGKTRGATHQIMKHSDSWLLINPTYTNLGGTSDQTHHWSSGQARVTREIDIWVVEGSTIH